jgi:2'-5' RNA ligase
MSLAALHGELAALYDRMWQDAVRQFQAGACAGDPFLGDREPDDDRTGITLMAPLPASAVDRLRELRAECAARFPGSYLVPEADLHVTVLSLEPARSGFVARPSELEVMIDAIQDALARSGPLPVELRGLGASPAAIIACGYPGSLALDGFREAVKRRCRERDTARRVDSRYTARGAHSTLVRFVRPIFPAEQVAWLAAQRAVPLGGHLLDRLALVGSDWYMRARSVVTYGTWRLPT